MNGRAKVIVGVLLVGLAGCMAVAPYNQSQDDLRTSNDKFGGKQLVDIPIGTMIDNTYQTIKHCKEHPVYSVAPDKQAMTASVMISGWSAPAYMAVIDFAAK